MNHIELFAGCGGLSLGLESEGFDLYFANEISPMAAETYAYNILNKDLRALAKGPGLTQENPIYWLRSAYARENLEARLCENPSKATRLRKPVNDLRDLAAPYRELNGSLIVGSITELNKMLESSTFRSAVKAGPSGEGIDLVSGGPPCQSFSMAGLRERSNNRNKLPGEFANFVASVQPKVALLENVPGILNAFLEHGEKHYAWFEVAKAFANKGYVPLCLYVNAKYVGAAQNRPRFIMLAFRKDFANKLLDTEIEYEFRDALDKSYRFFKKVHQLGEDIEYDPTLVHRVENGSPLFNSSLFAPLVERRNNRRLRPVSVFQAIDDLPDTGDGGKWRHVPSAYVNIINKTSFVSSRRPIQRRPRKPQNHKFRKNGTVVQARFRLYQALRGLKEVDQGAELAIRHYIRHGSTDCMFFRDEVKKLASMGWLMTPSGDIVSNPTVPELEQLLEDLRTKKHTQKALSANEPATAALSIPDDICHYREGTLRTLTIREMARIQSFPDWFIFRSKETTGAHMRSFEVPQYTQVGNAVPPMLGKTLGKICRDILEITD